MQTSTKVSLFRANNRWDPHMGFKMRKKEKFEKVKEFTTRMKEVHKEAEAVLKKSQEEMKKYTDRRRSEVEEYWVGYWVLLSTKDLKYQMKGRWSEKLTECFIGPYQVKGIISTNTIELDLPSTIKIYPVVNISRVQRYKDKIEGQKKKQLAPVIIREEEEYKVEKILNKKKEEKINIWYSGKDIWQKKILGNQKRT